MDISDGGLPPPQDDILELPFSIGGDYAAWEMTITGVSGPDTRVMKLRMSSPDDPQSVTFKLHKGNSYSVTMNWLGSGTHINPYWYCWEAKVGGLPSAATFNSYDSTRLAGVSESFSGSGWFVDNWEGLLTSHVHMSDDDGGNVAGSLTAVLHVVKVEFVDDTTTQYNFSPSLGEEANIKVKISPSFNYTDYSDYYFKLKIVRKTDGGGEQLIDWVDVGDPHYTIAAIIDFENKLFAWNGIPSDAAGNSASQVQGVDEFQGVSTSAKRVLPTVTQGEPVPPPLYTAVACIYKSNDQSLFCEASHKIFVPQVVKMMYDTASVDQMLTGYYTDDTGEAMILPIPTNQWPTYRAQIADQAQAYYSAENVNIRFVDSTANVLHPYSVMQMNGVTYTSDYLGSSPSPVDLMNADPSQTGMLYYLRFRQDIGDICFLLREKGEPLPTPVTSDEIIYLWAHVATHETGHTLGLVAHELLGGDASGNHNQFPHNYEIMDPGEIYNLYKKMGREGSGWNFRTLNADYIRFILPMQ